MSTNPPPSAPTLINLPPPPSDPVTPSDVPGTPNSTTTSMSELSTVAIKDGHRGHLPHHQQNPLDAERADRISRLAGLERVTAGRSSLTPGSAAYGHYTSGSGGSASAAQQAALQQQQAGQQSGAGGQGYFDANNTPHITRERSTVGSASATGSIGGRTTWASGSDAGFDGTSVADRMSEDASYTADETSSMGGFSDEGAASLVGFGEGARTPARAGVGGPASPVIGKAGIAQQQQQGFAGAASGVPLPAHLRGDFQPSALGGGPTMGGSGGSGASTPSTPEAQAQMLDAKRIDGVTFDGSAMDTTTATPPSAAGVATGDQRAGAATAEAWMRRQEEGERERERDREAGL